MLQRITPGRRASCTACHSRPHCMLCSPEEGREEFGGEVRGAAPAEATQIHSRCGAEVVAARVGIRGGCSMPEEGAPRPRWRGGGEPAALLPLAWLDQGVAMGR